MKRITRLFCIPLGMLAGIWGAVAGQTLPKRPIPSPIIESNAFAKAVARGTRTRDGRPGPKYWQQTASYLLTARLDPKTASLTGAGTVHYYNRSPDRLDSLALYLDQNLFAPNAVRDVIVPITGGVTLTRVDVNGSALPLAPRDSVPGYKINGTVLWLRLQKPLAAGDSITLGFEWSFHVPPKNAPRMGQDGEVFYLGYWYPRMAVYDDVNGWQVDQYMGMAEFYDDYASYDVQVTVPSGWLVAATGELQNPSDVLTDETRSRLANARSTGQIVHVVTDAERTHATKAETAPDAGVTWHYRAANVRDFAFGASDKYLWDAARSLIPARDGRPNGLDTVDINAFYRPAAPLWVRSAEYGRHAIEYLSKHLIPYPYPHMTTVEGLVGGGMEYPMITLIGAGRDSVRLQLVTLHEIGHMWFPMIVGSDERRNSWMDEGLTTFNQIGGVKEFWPWYNVDSAVFTAYLDLARAGGEVENMRNGDNYPNATAYRVATYPKTAAIMTALRGLLGDSAFTRAYQQYARTWAFRHPKPADLFYSFSHETGRDLTWFFRTWFFETWPLDQAIASVTRAGKDLQIVIEDHGLAPMPVRLALSRKGGRLQRVEVPVSVWLNGAKTHTVRIPGGGDVIRVEIDPEHVFPDIDRTNQLWEAK